MKVVNQHNYNNMKKLIPFLCVAIMMLSASFSSMSAATPEYRQAVVDLVLVSGDENFSFQQMEQAFTTYLAGKKPDVGATDVMALVQKYGQQQFKNDLYDVVMPYYEANLTLAEVKQLNAAFTSDEGREAVLHTRMINDPQQIQQLVAAMMPQINNIVQGKDVAISKPIECPAEYRKAFELYCNNCGMPSMIDNMFQSISTMFAAQIPDEAKRNEFVKTFSGFGDYMQRELPVMLLNISYGKIQQKDLDFYNRVLTSDEGKKMAKASLDLSADVANVGQKMIGNFDAWLSAQGK